MSSKTYKHIISILSLALAFSLGCQYTNIKASNNIQSQGKLIYTNPEIDEEVIIDTADHEILQEQINNVNDRLDGIRFGIDEDGNYGYYKVGADSVTPFKNNTNFIEVGQWEITDETETTIQIGIEGAENLTASDFVLHITDIQYYNHGSGNRGTISSMPYIESYSNKELILRDITTTIHTGGIVYTSGKVYVKR